MRRGLPVTYQSPKRAFGVDYLPNACRDAKLDITGLILINTFLLVTLFGLTFVFFQRFHRVDALKLQSGEKLPFVSVIVPARNEQGKIARCLESLLKQDYDAYEIVVIDDRSTDDTAEIIERIAASNARIKFVRNSQDAPSGWIGKCNALVKAVPHASGDWFIFTDADTCHSPQSLRLSVQHAQTKNADLISFMPLQELGSFWERLVMPVLLGSFLIGDPLNKINDPEDPRAYAYGQYILVKRSVYESVGGHTSVRDQILDDIVFARIVKKHGYRIFAADGAPLYSVRMYVDLPSLWQGWTKNVYALLECRLDFLFSVLLLLNAALILPFLHLAMILDTLINHQISPADINIFGLVAVEFALLYSWYHITKKHYVGVKPHHFWLLPFGSLFVTAIYLASAFCVCTGTQVNWKGRRYRVTDTMAIAPDGGLIAEKPVETVLARNPE